MLHYITLPYITLHCITLIAPPHMQLQLHCTNCTTPQLQLRHTTSTTTAALHHTTSSSCRWPLQPFQKTQLQPPFGPSVDLLCHPWFTTTNLSSRFPIFETSATALCGTTGMTLHYLSIIFRALTVNIILYMCVCAWACEPVVTDETQRDGRSGVWAWGGCHSSTWLVMSNSGPPKPVRHERSWKLHPAWPQVIANANPTLAS